MAEEIQNNYDEVPYESVAFPQTQPGKMATVAALFGMTPAPVTKCRVLELGCASGFNIIPMAATLPDSRFVGVDLSPRQVAEGQEAIRSLELTNIELRPMNIMDVGDDFGQFDYLICHGVFSWVPAEVREKVLEIAARNLAPQGVAYVSYNCFPGWHLAGVIREMMLYHTRRFTASAKRIQQAKAFLDYLAMGTLDPNSNYAKLLKEEAELLRRTPENYVFHEHLEEVNQPLYFHQFAERAAAHGLQYIWESYVGDRAGRLRNEAKETLDRLSTDVIRREQNIDFLINRRFRMSLLCHEDVALDRSLPPERLMSRFHFVGVARPESSPVDIGSRAKETFRAPGGETVTVDHPMCKAALACLHESSPQPFSFDELCDAVRARLEGATDLEPLADDDLRRGIAALLRECIWPRLVGVDVHPMGYNTGISERPAASRVARYQAKSSDRVANLRHENSTLSTNDRHILALLDGRRDRAAVMDALVGMVEAGQINIQVKGHPVRDEQQLRSILVELIDASLKRLASNGLLER
jgi:methyltransferase-like protein/SAM-dependent methyltransferase